MLDSLYLLSSAKQTAHMPQLLSGLTELASVAKLPEIN